MPGHQDPGLPVREGKLQTVQQKPKEWPYGCLNIVSRLPAPNPPRSSPVKLWGRPKHREDVGALLLPAHRRKPTQTFPGVLRSSNLHQQLGVASNKRPSTAHPLGLNKQSETASPTPCPSRGSGKWDSLQGAQFGSAFRVRLYLRWAEPGQRSPGASGHSARKPSFFGKEKQVTLAALPGERRGEGGRAQQAHEGVRLFT